MLGCPGGPTFQHPNILTGRAGVFCYNPRPKISRPRCPGGIFTTHGGNMKFWITRVLVLAMLLVCVGTVAYAQGAAGAEAKTEANLVLPDLHQVSFLGVSGHTLLVGGLFVCILGGVFGLVMYIQLRDLPVHKSMRDISELIYETCKTYLTTQGKFIAVLWAFIAVIMVVYFGALRHYEAMRVIIIVFFSVIGILGSYGVAWFGIRINTFANSRSAFASLGGKPFPTYRIPLEAGMSIGMLLISVELVIMLCILLFVPRDYAGPCFIGFALCEPLGAAAPRLAGGHLTELADISCDPVES